MFGFLRSSYRNHNLVHFFSDRLISFAFCLLLFSAIYLFQQAASIPTSGTPRTTTLPDVLSPSDAFAPPEAVASPPESVTAVVVMLKFGMNSKLVAAVTA
jgi:hypothetical protein